MKRITTVAVALALLTAIVLHWNRSVSGQAGVIPSVAGNPNALSYSSGVYYSPAYNWRGFTETAISVTGSSTSVVLGPSVITLPDGRQVHPFGAQDNQNTPVTFDMGANAETITPTAVSVTTCPTVGDFSPPAQCVTFTGTFTNTHGPHTFIGSGSQGTNEAIADAGSNGGGLVYWQIDPGIVTLNTGGANTTDGSIFIPARSTIMSATARVTTTIGTCAGGWSLGFSTGTEFTAANTTLTAGTTTDSSTISTPVTMNAAATIPIIHCTTSNASAGAVHAKYAGYKLAAPLS